MIRAYQTPNLLSIGPAEVFYATEASDPTLGASNLVENLSSRSSTSSWKARLSNSSVRVDHKSCYIVTSDAVKADGNLLKLVIDLKQSFFQHAVLVVGDLYDGSDYWLKTGTPLVHDLNTNFEFYF